MNLRFDRRGNLIPDSNIRCQKETFYRTFISELDSPKRAELYQNFEKYINELKTKLGFEKLLVWINGSFTTKKQTPNDMDLLVFIDFDVAEKLNNELEDFKYPNSLIKFDLDAYVIKVYPHDHKMNSLYKADKIYWMDLFTKNKRNRRGNKIPKGFIEMEI